MNEDIIEQLKIAHEYEYAGQDMYMEAIDEIERLRKLGDTMAYFVRSGDAKEMYSAVYAWEEARRG